MIENLFKYNKNNNNYTVAVAMSGGVDSSTAAYILKEQGYRLIGVTMKQWNSKEKDAFSHIADAKKVCSDLNINHYVIELQSDFQKKVIDYFINEYKSGKTPNPCMKCNREIKMGKFIEHSKKLGADYFATGHYAIIKNKQLYTSKDPQKDQAYFLSQIKKDVFKNLLFPLGDMEKKDVRKIAKKMNIRVHDKKDSQELCFVEDNKHKEFLLKNYSEDIIKKGHIVDTSGKKLGEHEGIVFYTIGQRKGLGISSKYPLYVIRLDNINNQVVVGENKDLFKSKIKAKEINLLAFNNIEELHNIKCNVKTRSRDSLHKAIIKVTERDQIEAEILGDQVRAITKGQGLVLYREDGLVLASGYIC